jgi:hypothetical protein
MSEDVSIQQLVDLFLPGLRSLRDKYDLPDVEIFLEWHNDIEPMTLTFYHNVSGRSIVIRPILTVAEIKDGSYKDKWRPRVKAAFTAFAALIA